MSAHVFLRLAPTTLEEDPKPSIAAHAAVCRTPRCKTPPGPLAGTLEGLNQKQTRTRLLHFDLRSGTINVQLTRGQGPFR